MHFILAAIQLIIVFCCYLCSYEQDTELFNFDYKDDLLMMARERERVFALQRFS